MSQEAVRALVLPSVSKALYCLLAASSSQGSESRLTVVVGDLSSSTPSSPSSSTSPAISPSSSPSTAPRALDVVVYAEPLPAAPKWPVQIDIRPGQRDDPELKSSIWVEARRSYKAQKDPESDEVVLVSSDDGRLYEGLSSNFLALIGDPNDRASLSLLTAPPGSVLTGTMLQVVLDAASAMGIKVVREAPLLSGSRGWAGACVCSTTRLLLPIDRIRLVSANGQQDDRFSLPIPLVLRELVDEARHRLPQHAEYVPPPAQE